MKERIFLETIYLLYEFLLITCVFNYLHLQNFNRLTGLKSLSGEANKIFSFLHHQWKHCLRLGIVFYHQSDPHSIFFLFFIYEFSEARSGG